MKNYKIHRECWNERTYNGYDDSPYWRILWDGYEIGLRDDGYFWDISNKRPNIRKDESIKLCLKEICKQCGLNIPLFKIEYHRPPTPYEIKFGEGATHYLEFDIEFCMKPDGTLKRWVICPVTGLKYYR